MIPPSGIHDIRAIVAKLDPYCRQLVTQAAELAYKGRHDALDVIHVLAVLFKSSNETLLERLISAGLDVVVAARQADRALTNTPPGTGLPPALSSQLVDVLRDSWLMVSLKGKDSVVDADTMLAAIMANTVLCDRLCESLPELRKFSIAALAGPDRHSLEPQGAASDHLQTGSALARFTIDLNARVLSNHIDPVIGREREIAQLIEILLRRRQNNPILTGEAGVGKTAIVEGLAQRICAGLVPDTLKDVVIHSLDMGLLKAGAGVRGEIESRLKQIISEIATAARPIILFIDEAHTLVGSGSSGEHNDIANLVKPELARGSLRTIAATTWSEYKRFFEKDAALSRRFQVVKVIEPSPQEAQQILQGLIPALQKHHGVHILQSAITSAVSLSSRYIQGRQLPDKAISVLDTACARAVAARSGPANELVSIKQRLELVKGQLAATELEVSWGQAALEQVAVLQLEMQQLEQQLAAAAVDVPPARGKSKKRQKANDSNKAPAHVGPAEVAAVIADWTGVPSQQMLVDQSDHVLTLESAISQRVVGQTRAIQIICNRIQTYTARLDDPNRPIGVFMLAGSSGVGKTETALALADTFFGGDHSITVINMSEYQEAHTVSKLKGAPPGYVGFGQGGTLTEAIRRRPYGLLLLDEIEKAHPDVLDLFLQVFDKGFLEDAEGIKVDFKNTLIMLTSNAGSELFEHLEEEVPSSGDARTAFEQRLHAHLAGKFRAAFLGRVHVVSFMPLTQESVRRIVVMRLDVMRQRFNSAYGADISFSPELVELIVGRCINASVGARLIDQFVAENVLARLSSYILDQMAKRLPIQAVSVDVGNGEVVLAHEPNQ